MNGEPLSPDHGAPFRLIVPHWYAVASVKWLKRIDVLTEPYAGRVPDRPLHLRVARPAARAGQADARARADHRARRRRRSSTAARTRCAARRGREPGPITQVDVSLTGEGEWHPAQLEPPKGPYHWQDWSFDWAADDIGRHTLRARATDAAGNVQPEVPPWNRLGYGNNAIEVIYVDVA